MVGCPEAFTRAGDGPEWRETTTMPLTTSPASTATVIRRRDAGSVPGPDGPTAGRARMSIGRLPSHGRLGREVVPEPGGTGLTGHRGRRRRAYLGVTGADLVLHHEQVYRGGDAGAGLLLATPGQERGGGQAQPRHGQGCHGDRADRPSAPGLAQAGP